MTTLAVMVVAMLVLTVVRVAMTISCRLDGCSDHGNPSCWLVVYSQTKLKMLMSVTCDFPMATVAAAMVTTLSVHHLYIRCRGIFR